MMKKGRRKYAVGIDLGGTFVKYALVSDLGEILFDGILPVGRKSEREDILKTIKFSIQKAMEEAAEKSLKLSGIGIGSPGIVCNGVVWGC